MSFSSAGFFIIITVLGCSLLTTISAEVKGNNINNIVTSKNVDQLLDKQKLSLVLFYASWQKECQPMVNLVDRLSRRFQQYEEDGFISSERKKVQQQEDEEYTNDDLGGSNTSRHEDTTSTTTMTANDVFIGKADVYNDLKLATRFMVEDYCVLKYFVKGSNVAETYTGNFTEVELVKFIIEISETDITDNDFKQMFINLDSETFARYARDKTKTVIVLFHAKWCKKCLVLLKTLKNVARRFKKEPNCVFAHIDGENNYDISLSEKVGLYPTFMFYSRENKDGEVYLPGKFEEKWSEKNITKYMSVHCKSKIADEHILDKLIGRMDDLDVFTRNFILRVGNPKEQERIIRETVLKIQMLAPAKRFTANYYVEVMRTMVKRSLHGVGDDNSEGDDFLDGEITKIDKMMLTEMLAKHKDEMSEKRNILHHFRSHRRGGHYRRDEL